MCWLPEVRITIIFSVLSSHLNKTFLLQSPRWLIKKGNDKGAARSLGRLLGLSPDSPEIQAELDEIRTNLEEERRIGETGYLDCFRSGPNKLPLRTWTGIFLQAWWVSFPFFFVVVLGLTYFFFIRL
jgi:MFS transporter, SP family, sugar:H+ symporter